MGSFYFHLTIVLKFMLVDLSFYFLFAGILRYKVDFQSMQLEDGLYEDEYFDLDDY